LRQGSGKHRFLDSRGKRLDSSAKLGFFHVDNRGVLLDEIFVKENAGEAFNVVFFDGSQVLLRKTEFVGDLCDCAALMLACAPENSSYGVHCTGYFRLWTLGTLSLGVL
jgi:hypothetical protein